MKKKTTKKPDYSADVRLGLNGKDRSMMKQVKLVAGEPAKPIQLNDLFIDALLLGDMIKYNLFLLSKSIVFASIYQHNDLDESVELTNKVMNEIDLLTKKKLEEQNKKE